jgi:hypothetical protein
MENQRREMTVGLVAGMAGVTLLSQKSVAQTCTAPCYIRTPSETSNGVVPADTSYPPGSLLRYGADPTGVNASDIAINNALLCNYDVFDDFRGGSGTYLVSSPLRFRAYGQILRGRGMGEASVVPGTTLRSASSFSGPIVSMSNGTRNFSDCSVRDLLIDGNSSANIGIQGNDDSVAGGCWRNRYENVAIINVTGGTNPTAIYLGNLTTAYSNDPIVHGCFISSCGRGVSGAGALIQFTNTTIVGSTISGVQAITGSAWTFSNCVFSKNARDFDGATIQQAAFSGCWFENSAFGIYRAAGQHSCSFTGCYLHTSNTTSMMDFGSAAGYHFLGGNFLPSGTKSVLIANVNGGATGSVLGQAITLTQSNGVAMPEIIPALQTGTGTVRSASAQLTHGQSVTLNLGRGCFFVAANVWNTANASIRTQASYTAFLFDGNNEAVTQSASRNGSGGAETFTISGATNAISLTYTGTDTVTVFVSGTGVAG